MLSNEGLAGLRALADEFLPESCAVQRPTDTATGDGTAQSWTTIATVACRVSPVGHGGAESLGASGGIQAIGQRRVTLPAGTDVTTRDRLVVGSHTYEVLDAPVRSYAVALTVVCAEMS